MGRLIQLSVKTFGDIVAADVPAPGGGSVAALAGSLAASLAAMVCRLSLGREDVAATDEELNAALDELERLRGRLLELVDEDTVAFEAVMTAFRMPKSDDVERSARAAAIDDATLGAARPPLETLEAAGHVLALSESLAGRSNVNAASDLGAAVHLALAAAEAALMNVRINLAPLPAGEEVDRYRAESEAAIEAARAAAARASAGIASTISS